MGPCKSRLQTDLRDRFDAFQVALGGGLPASLVLPEDPIDERVAVLPQGRDRGQRLELAEPAGEASDLLLYDRLALDGLLGARAEVARDERLQVVDVVERHPRQLPAALLDVPRHGDVDQQQGAVLAGLDDLLELLVTDDRVRRGCRADHDVGLQELVGEPVEPHDRAAEALREAARAVGVAVGDEDRPGSLVDERAGRQFAGLARSEDHRVACGERAEDVAGEIDGHRGDAHVVLGDARLGPHALARREGGREQPVGERAGGPGRERRLIGALDLALDLGLAGDHRVEPGGDAVELSRGVAVARRVDRLGDLGRADAGVAGEHRSTSPSARRGSPTTR